MLFRNTLRLMMPQRIRRSFKNYQSIFLYNRVKKLMKSIVQNHVHHLLSLFIERVTDHG
jgi:hypothetical protein